MHDPSLMQVVNSRHNLSEDVDNIALSHNMFLVAEQSGKITHHVVHRQKD